MKNSEGQEISALAVVFWNAVVFFVVTVVGCVLTGQKPAELPVIGWMFDVLSNLLLWVSWVIFAGYFGFIAICILAMIYSAARGRF